MRRTGQKQYHSGRPSGHYHHNITNTNEAFCQKNNPKYISSNPQQPLEEEQKLTIISCKKYMEQLEKHQRTVDCLQEANDEKIRIQNKQKSPIPQLTPYQRRKLFDTPFFIDNSGSEPQLNSDAIYKKNLYKQILVRPIPCVWKQKEDIALVNATVKSMRERQQNRLSYRNSADTSQTTTAKETTTTTTTIDEYDTIYSSETNTNTKNEKSLNTKKVIQPISRSFFDSEDENDEALFQAAKNCSKKKNLNTMRIDVGLFALQINYDDDESETSDIRQATTPAIVQPSLSEKSVLEVDNTRINWAYIARTYVCGNKTGFQCRQRWMHLLDPSLNKSTLWNEKVTDNGISEFQQQQKICKEYKYRDWESIQSKMTIKRSVFSLVTKYISTSKNFINSNYWLPEEDEKLIEAVKQYGIRQFGQVSQMIGNNRTPNQCSSRWKKSLDPLLKSGKWNIEEDLRLLLASKAYITPDSEALNEGIVDSTYNSWIEISQHIPGRSDMSCRERLMRAYNIFYRADSSSNTINNTGSNNTSFNQNSIKNHNQDKQNKSSINDQENENINNINELNSDKLKDNIIIEIGNTIYEIPGNDITQKTPIGKKALLHAVDLVKPGNWSAASVQLQNRVKPKTIKARWQQSTDPEKKLEYLESISMQREAKVAHRSGIRATAAITENRSDALSGSRIG